MSSEANIVGNSGLLLHMILWNKKVNQVTCSAATTWDQKRQQADGHYKPHSQFCISDRPWFVR